MNEQIKAQIGFIVTTIDAQQVKSFKWIVFKMEGIQHKKDFASSETETRSKCTMEVVWDMNFYSCK
jgi:hypothetical protein